MQYRYHNWNSTVCTPAALCRALLLLALVCSQALLAQTEAEATAGTENVSESDFATALERERAFMITEDDDGGKSAAARAQERAFLDAIHSIENDHGAYAAELPEQMLSLGLALQQQDRHGEALDIFKRGVHLARVNSGLYSVEQIPLLEAEIHSFMALGEYGAADDRQAYLYRVQVRSLSTSQERVAALMKQANWQYRAYRLSLGLQGLERLTIMWDLYAQALNEIIDDGGKKSPRLLAPLYGMLRTQYLIAANQDLPSNSAMAFNADYSAQAQASRFYAYRSRIYSKGRTVIASIYEIEKAVHGEASLQVAEAIAQLGDWALWNGNEGEAGEVYQLALTELAGPDVAKDLEGQLFAEPVPLPDVDGIRPFPPSRGPKPGDILLEFAVTAEGRVTDLVRQDSNEDGDDQANRLMRELRGTVFRPRFEAGQPVGTDKLVRAYDITQ